MIQSHYHQRNPPWLPVIKRWVCASEVALTETESKGDENGVLKVNERAHTFTPVQRLEYSRQTLTDMCQSNFSECFKSEFKPVPS